MSEASAEPNLQDIPEALPAPERRRPLQLVWLIPVVVVLIGGWLAVKAYLERGPTITISFRTAEGLEVGKTKIKYKNVDIGEVKTIAFSEDRSRVLVTAQIAKYAEGFLVEDTRFWVVRPRIAGGSVSGLGTLLSGSYIGMDIGKSGVGRREFAGLETPPVFTADVPGREFMLRGDDLGSLDIGSPVYLRHIQVGQVVALELDEDGRGVTLRIFVNAPYERHVTANTRFWHASGVDVALNADGMKIETESLVSILLGGLAFETPAGFGAAEPAARNAVFHVFGNREQALKSPAGAEEILLVVFRESVRGLSAGAPVDFRGIAIGEVAGIDIGFDAARQEFTIPVKLRVFPERLRARFRGPATAKPANSGELLERLVARGFRAQLRTGNLLTGQLYVALDFFPDAPKAKLDRTASPLELPAMPASLQELQTSIASIAKKIDRVPIEALGGEMLGTLKQARALVERIDRDLAPELKDRLHEARDSLAAVTDAMAAAEKTLKAAQGTLSADGPLQRDARETMREIARAARAFRLLADYLERHPEALIRGRQEDER